jgi:hypothetical protein
MSTLAYFLLWGAFFFFMMRFGCGSHVMGHRSGHRYDHGTPDTSESTEGGVSPKSREKSQ